MPCQAEFSIVSPELPPCGILHPLLDRGNWQFDAPLLFRGTHASRVSCSELLSGMPALQTEASVSTGFSGLGLLWLYRRRLGLKEFGEALFSPSRIWAASLT